MSGGAGARPGSAVVFDFGAVLFRWQPVELLRTALPGLATSDDAARALAASVFESFTPESDWALFDLGRLDEAALAERIARRLSLQADDVRRLVDAIPPHLVPIEPMVALARRLKAAGHRMFFLSNMPAPYAAALQAANAFIGEVFDDGIFSAHVGLMKPQPAIFDAAGTRFALQPSATLFIDDHRGNVEAARSAGWSAIRYADPAQCEAEVLAAGWLPSPD